VLFLSFQRFQLLKHFSASNIRDNIGSIPSVRPTAAFLAAKVGEPVFSLPFEDIHKKISLVPKKPRLLKLALEAARHRVFNEMPIRLLTFKSDGSGIKLLDRSDTWNHVSTLIQAEFEEDKMSNDSKQRTTGLVNNPGAEKEAIDAFI
jgi:hypothetical protein